MGIEFEKLFIKERLIQPFASLFSNVQNLISFFDWKCTVDNLVFQIVLMLKNKDVWIQVYPWLVQLIDMKLKIEPRAQWALKKRLYELAALPSLIRVQAAGLWGQRFFEDSWTQELCERFG